MSEANGPPENTSPEALATQLESRPSGEGVSDPEATIDSSGAIALSATERTVGTAHKSIGPYQLIRKLGEGGMGQVWLAEQKEPIQRQVALKLIRVGVYDDEVLQRFYAERRSLAMMDHPSIAKVFDAGATPDGQPYFVMEYVPGFPITEYCDRKHLNIHERLELFIKVCEGVQHAHQKALVHRDLKPANILVVEVDGKPVPRIIDFGLAKAVSPQLDGETLATKAGEWVGTPGYMSPEQADAGRVDVDTRTDVYSLGAVLYVLLTGFLPFETRDQRFEEFLRRLRQEDPLRPSTKVGTEKESSKAISEARGTEPGRLVTLLHGDLDWITMKALEKDRARRYGTPMELAADIGRHLNNEPIVARPASTAYRLQKYVRRHRVGVVVAVGLVIMLVGFGVNQAIQVRRITRERDRANRITGFMKSMFQVSDPSEARGNSITAREILDKASKEIDTGLTKDPETQAEMSQVMGDVYRSLGLYVQAEPLLTNALDIRRQALGKNDPDTLDSMSSLALLLHSEGREADAERLQREILVTERGVFGPTDPRTVASEYQLSRILGERGHYADAEKIQRDVLALEQQIHGPESHQAIMAQFSLALTLLSEGHFRESEDLGRQSLDAAQRVLGNEHPDTLRIMSLLGMVFQNEGRYSDEEKVERQVIDVERRVLGPEHPQTLQSMQTLAVSLNRQNRNEEAEKLQRYIVQEETRILSPDHRSLLVGKEQLASTLRDEKKFDESETLLREVIESDRRVLGPEHPNTLDAIGSLGNTLMEAGRYSEAEELFRQVFATQERVLGPDNPNTAINRYNVGAALAYQGRKAEAISFLTEAVDHGLPAQDGLGMDKDPDLNALHGEPAFAALLAHAKEVAAEKQKATPALASAQKTN